MALESKQSQVNPHNEVVAANEMDALYQQVRGMNDMQLRLVRLYASQLNESEETIQLKLMPQGKYFVQGTANIH
jgi:hypothetical protein